MPRLQNKSSPNDSADDPNRALFGSRGNPPASQPPRAHSSPYNDPQAQRQDPYAQRPPYGQRPDPYAQRPDPYAQRPDPYAQRQDPYARTNQPRPSPAPRGYSNESQDINRNALFGNRPPLQTDGYERSGSPYGSNPEPEPDRYEEYQQQAENSDEDVEAVKQEIRFTKQNSLSSTRNAIRIASEAEETGRNSLTKLGAQSEKLSGIERNLDVSAAHARIAKDKARELKKLNRSIFAVHVSNPFGGASRAEEEERKITERHEIERDERERNRKFAYDSAQRVDSALNKPGSGRKGGNSKNPGRPAIAARSAFSFEEDEEDVQMERDIDSNLNTLANITNRLKGVALATQTEIKSQNEKLDQIANKVIIFLECGLMIG